MKVRKTSQEKPSSERYQWTLGFGKRWLSGTNAFLLWPENNPRKSQVVDWAFLVPPQKVSKNIQDYEKSRQRHFTQSPVMQSDAFSCTTPKFIQATNKTCRPNRTTASFLLKAEKLSKKSKILVVNGDASNSQVVGYKAYAFTSTSLKFATIRSKRKTVLYPCYPRHPWSISAFFAFSAVKSLSGSSPYLRISVVKLQP